MFRAQGERPAGEAAAVYEARRGTARERGYGPRWDKVSIGFKRSHPLCLGCEAIGEIKATEVTDHVEPHKGDQIKFWNAKLWQPACRWHHDAVKKILEQMFERGEISIADLWLNGAAAVRITLSLKA